jgi:hypothetical protein
MKKLILTLAVLAVGAAFAQDAEYAITVPATNSTAILPPRDNKQVNIDGLWTTNSVVTNGQIFRVLTTSLDYMVLVGGTTSTNTYPSGTSGQVETSGSVTLIHCHYLSPRTAAHVTQEADADIWYHTGLTATTNGGEYAFSEGQQFRTNEKGAVSVWAATEVKLAIKDQ